MATPDDSTGDVFLIVTASVPRVELLTDTHVLADTLRGLVQQIGMNPIAEPQVLTATNNPGLEGYIPIDASNITISTYTHIPRIVLAIHSCRDFEQAKVIAFIKQRYECEALRYRVVLENELRGDSGD